MPSGASSRTVTWPLASTVRRGLPSAVGAALQDVAVDVAQPRASRTTAWNEKLSPVRRSFREGRTSSRAGSPGVAQARAGGSSGFVGGFGVDAAAAAVLSVATAGCTSSYVRERFTSAMQHPSFNVISYRPVSEISTRVSLETVTRVLMTARLGSAGGVEQRVRQTRPEPSRVCESRTSVGSWS